MDITQAIFVILTGAVLALVGVAIKSYGKDNVIKVYEIVKILVQGVEQLSNLYGYTGDKKKKLVMAELKKKFPNLEEKELEQYLESAVFEMNKLKDAVENKIIN